MSPAEPYRSTLVTRTVAGETATLIVLRRPDHRAGKVWLTMGATEGATIALHDDQVSELTGMLTAAWLAGGQRGRPAQPSRAAIDAAAGVILGGDLLQQVLAAGYEVDRGAA